MKANHVIFLQAMILGNFALRYTETVLVFLYYLENQVIMTSETVTMGSFIALLRVADPIKYKQAQLILLCEEGERPRSETSCIF
jgi:putative Ca2+/H+ antiporter (TMEM165/GDT1 family)